jgi:Predicted Zn-dependent protease (DUF2268)
MKTIKLISLALLMSFSSLQAQIEVITSDITNFWIAFDSVQTTPDTAKQAAFIQKYYLDKASFGLKYTIDFTEKKAADWVGFIGDSREKLQRIRPYTLYILAQKPVLDKKIAYFKELYPDFKKGNIYFVIGTGIFGGRVSEGKVIVGAEVEANEKPDWPIGIVLHEFVHTQQFPPKRLALLGNTIMEGMADFIAEVVNQQDLAVTYPDRHTAFGNKNEKAVWAEFKKYVSSSGDFKFFDWLYGSTGRTINEVNMRDLGYFVGYKICKSYYEKATDKKAAIKEMLALDCSTDENAKAFLIKSGYAPDGDKKFIENLVFAPLVLAPKNIKLTQYGYEVKGENVVFAFDIPKSVPLSDIKKVTLAGTFNGWNPKDDKLMLAFVKDRKYELALPKSKFEKGKTYAFKFVVNGSNWQGAPETAKNVEVGDNRNITLVVE